MDTTSPFRTIEGIDSTALEAIALVGKIVTYRDNQYKIHSVEGSNFYAFNDRDNTTTCDFNLTPIHLPEPTALLIPPGAELGQGFSVTAPVRRVRRGVCLVKSYV